MKKNKKVLRLLGFAVLIILAMTGVGIFGALFRTDKKYADKPVTIERRDEDDDFEADREEP